MCVSLLVFLSKEKSEVSIDITAAGVAANNLYSLKSGYSNAIKNDAILGITPEFVYTEGLKVEDVIINFDIDKTAQMNYNNKYTGVSDEFAGIKRLNVFKFFEDTNMLLPIETFHDVENNRVYTHVDELGTYCLMDMEIWLESLGITAENLTGDTNAAVFSARSMAVAYSDDDTEESERDEQECLDVVLVAYPGIALIDETKSELKITSKEIFDRAAKENLDARIYFVDFLGSSIKTDDGKLYAETYKEAESIINRQPAINGHSETSYALYKALNYVNHTLLNQFRADSKRYCFVIDVGGYPATDVSMGAVPALKENGVVIGFSYNRGNSNADKYTLLATNALCEQAVIGGGRYNFGDFIVNEIFGNHEKEYPIISAVGWKRIKLDKPITEDYRSYALAIENDPSLHDGVVNLNKFADTDNDGLLDLEEIMFQTEKGNDLITFNKGEVILPNFEDCTGNLPWSKHIFYVEKGIERYTNFANFQDLFGLKILPIKSDPTNPDGDGDGISDYDDMYWNGIDERYKNVNPLKSDTLESFYKNLKGRFYFKWNGVNMDIKDNNLTLNVSAKFDSKTEKYKNLIIQNITQKWGGTYEGTLYDFYPGMTITVSVKFNTDFYTYSSQKDACVQFSGDCIFKKTSYHNALSNTIHFFSEHLNNESIGIVAAHEFGHVLGLNDAHAYDYEFLLQSLALNTQYIPLSWNVIDINENEIKMFNENNNGEIMYFGVGHNTCASTNDIEMFLQQMSDLPEHGTLPIYRQHFAPVGLYDVSAAIKKRPLIYFNKRDSWVYSYNLGAFEPIPKYEVPDFVIEEYKLLYDDQYIFGKDFLELEYSFQQYIKQTYKLDCSLNDVFSYSGIVEGWKNREKM